MLQARLPKKSVFGHLLSREKWLPGHENPAVGFFWGVGHH